MNIIIKLFDQPDIKVLVNDTESGSLYYNLTKKINNTQLPFYQDTAIYTPAYLLQLAQEAKRVLGWNWMSDHYDISVATKLHKDLENFFSEFSHDDIPEEHDTLIYNLHHCLHAIQFGNSGRQTSPFQIEWLTDESVELPESFEFTEQCSYGDLILLNPYVGHNPLQIYNENDFSSLSTTCRFHDIIKPGIVLVQSISEISKEKILSEFKKNDPDFVNLHGEQKIKYYSGAAVIGKVQDANLFKSIMEFPGTLELDRVEFCD